MTLQASTTPALPSPQKILQEIFGYSDFRPPQDEIIATVVTGGDALVLMPTGGGKSLCYQLPALLDERQPGGGIKGLKRKGDTVLPTV